MRKSLVAAALGVSMAAVNVSHAQERNPAAAEALFLQGRAAMNRGDFQDACSKLAESNKLDPGAGTLFNLADCQERLGHIAEAWQLWREAIGLLPPNDSRLVEARKRLEANEERLPWLTLALSKDAPPGAQVRRNGIVVGSAALGVPLPLNPGKHEITASAPKQPEKRLVITLAEGERKQVVIDFSTDKKEAPNQPSTSLYRWSLGMGAASLALWGAVGGVAGSTMKGYAHLSETCAGTVLGCPSDDIKDIEQRALATNILVGVASAATVSSLLILVIAKRTPDKVNAVVAVAPFGASVLVHY